MTDNDIKKALEWHLNSETNCDGCPFKDLKYTNGNCVGKMLKDALDLINRQQAEIEDVNVYCENLEYSQSHLLNELSTARKTAKTEAVKEFAEKVETELYERVSENIRKRNPHWYIAKRIVRETAIEMTEESK